ncbi:hypothetical protein [Noviherbaspirillum sp.]|uniref:hypothetical protein n=1 Tax=Noviherbaspirillum sp. TaxID=1926288 RepID=UPI002D2274E0|nr:hypothetical protein [Noviherbaspirillum sp.]HZW20640.1 hypothetical protein [Noviherbaspirillum sp.]
MPGFITNVCNPFNSCWNTASTLANAERDAKRNVAPPRTGTPGIKPEKPNSAFRREIKTSNSNKPVERPTHDDSTEDEVAEEGYERREIPSIPIKASPFDPATTPTDCLSVHVHATPPEISHEDVVTAGIEGMQSQAPGDEEKLEADPVTREMVEHEVEMRTNEMARLIRKAEVSSRGAWENLNNELLAWFVDPFLAELLQNEELSNIPPEHRADYFLVNPHRFTSQDEIMGTVSFWMHTIGLQVCLAKGVLAFKHLHSDSLDANAVRAGDLDLQRAFSDFIARAAKAPKPTLAILNTGNHWMGAIADTRGDTPVYYICDTNAPKLNDRDEVEVSGYLDKLEQFSGGQIKRTNTVYCGYPMQLRTTNACGPLACWMLERISEKLKTEPDRDIRMLLNECYREWFDLTNNSQNFEREFARRRRALMFARMGTWSTTSRQGLPAGSDNGFNVINYA